MTVRKPRVVFLAVTLTIFLLLVAAGCGGGTEETLSDERFDYSQLMRDLGDRYGDLYFAANQENWEYAEVQALAIKKTLESAEATSRELATGREEFLESTYPGIVDAIKSKDAGQFEDQFNNLVAQCNTCHLAQGAGYAALQVPSNPSSPVLVSEKAAGSEGTPVASKAEALFKSKCTICHGLDWVQKSNHKVDEWADVVERMEKKGAPVSDGQTGLIVAFLKETSGGAGVTEDSGGSSAPPADGESGGGDFDGKAFMEKVCTSCHDTQRIVSVKKDEAGWKETVERMKGKGGQVDAASEGSFVKWLVENYGS